MNWFISSICWPWVGTRTRCGKNIFFACIFFTWCIWFHRITRYLTFIQVSDYLVYSPSGLVFHHTPGLFLSTCSCSFSFHSCDCFRLHCLLLSNSGSHSCFPRFLCISQCLLLFLASGLLLLYLCLLLCLLLSFHILSFLFLSPLLFLFLSC